MKTPPPTISPELVGAVAAYKAAKTYADSIRPTVQAYQQEIVLAQNLRYADEGVAKGWYAAGRITKMKDAWMMDDAQAPAFFAALDAAHKAHGFEVPEIGYCPLLMAEEAERKAANGMIDAAEYITHISLDMATGTLATYAELKRIIVGLVDSLTPVPA